MSFADLGLVPQLLTALDQEKLREPTPVQRLAVPAMLGRRSVFVVARTGSGKTLAYSLPLLQLLSEAEAADGMVSQRARPRALVLTSTRELVDQTMKVLKSLSHSIRARIRGISGGMLPSEMGKRLAEPVDVVVGNPTRIATLVREKKLDLSDLRMLVVDEADTLLSPGQYADLKLLLDQPGTFPRCYFSATLPEPMRQVVVGRPEKPVVLLSKDAHSASDRVKVQNLQVKGDDRLDTTHDMLLEIAKTERGIIFANRRESVALLATALAERGHDLLTIHGAMLPNERRTAIKAFREGKGRFLVTTELGGRGLDIDGLTWVINHELPERPSEYLHRIGRIGRAGGPKGQVINLIGPGDSLMAAEIKRLATGARLDTGEALRGLRKREEGKARKQAQEARPRRPTPKLEPVDPRGEPPLPGGRRGRARPKNPGRGKGR